METITEEIYNVALNRRTELKNELFNISLKIELLKKDDEKIKNLKLDVKEIKKELAKTINIIKEYERVNKIGKRK